MVSMSNLTSSLKAVGTLAIGTGVAGLYAMISVVLVSVFSNQVTLGRIPVPNTTSFNVTSTIETLASTIVTANITIVGLVTLIGGLASLVIIVLALLGKVDFSQSGGKGGNKMY